MQRIQSRIFSQAKKLITDERNRLQEESVEASECQKNWQLRGLVQRLGPGGGL